MPEASRHSKIKTGLKQTKPRQVEGLDKNLTCSIHVYSKCEFQPADVMLANFNFF
jgi:hypothetical protein